VHRKEVEVEMGGLMYGVIFTTAEDGSCRVQDPTPRSLLGIFLTGDMRT
jgi:hypothetical protein